MHRAKKDAAEAVGEAAGVCRHNESQRWLDMRVGSPEDCYRDPPVVPQPPTSSATEESEGAPPLTAGLAAHRPTKHPLEHLYKYLLWQKLFRSTPVSDIGERLDGATN